MIQRVQTIFTGVSGSPWYSNLFFGTAAGDPEALAASNLVQAFWTDLRSLIKENIVCTVQPDVYEIDPFTGTIEGITNVPQTPLVCLGAQDMLPPSAQALGTLRTGVYRYGRPVIGKMFLPGFTELSLLNGTLTATAQATVQGALDDLVAGVPGSAELVVYSRPKFLGGDPPVSRPGAASTVVSASVPAKFAVLRSRRD